MSEPTYPDDLRYHAEHDWARIEGDEATFGITWYAQDALGEVVFFDAPAVGSTVTQDSTYTEVESVKAVSDVIAPMSGEVIAVNESLSQSPEAINEDPYGEGWLVRVRLSDPSRGRFADGCLRLPRDPDVSTYTSVTDADRDEMLAAIGVGSIDELFADIPPELRCARPLALDRGLSEQEVYSEIRAMSPRNVEHR